MVYTITFNPAVDYVMSLDSLKQGGINRSNEEKIYYGGKGINVSVILTRLGIENRALGFTAGFTGSKLENLLSKDGVIHDFVHLKNGQTRINVKLRAEDETDINAGGPDISEQDMEKLTGRLERLAAGDWLVLAGSVPDGVSSDAYGRILSRLDGRGVNFAVDAQGELLLNSLRHKPFLIKPNHIELGELFDTEIKTMSDIEYYAARLQKAGAKNVLVSLAADGAVLLDEKGVLHKSRNAKGSLVSSVGCGDSMVAGFIAGYIKTGDYDFALGLATACGNATAFSDSLATAKEIEDILNQ